MTDKILAWCRDQALFTAGDHVLLAISGGADSTAMLHSLLFLQRDLAITLEAAHFNHHLRGAESDRDEAFCRTLCENCGVHLHTGGADVAGYAKSHGLGLEEAARKLRYAFLCSVCAGGRIATAHTADDNLETMLMNLLRGCALRGLGGIPPVRGNIVRPLLCITRQELMAYLAARHLTFVEDSSNQSHEFLRNRIRHDALPSLRRELPDLPTRALDTALHLREDEGYLQSRATALCQSAKRPGGYDAQTLLSAPSPLRLRALAQILREYGAHDLTGAHLRAASRLLSAAHPAARFDAPGVTLRRQYELLTAQPLTQPAPIAPLPVPVPGKLSLPDGKTLLCACGVFQPGTLPYPAAFALNPALLTGLTVRSRAPGDLLTGPGGTKLLKKWMIDRKIPAPLRAAVPVLAIGAKVVAVFGVAADPAFRANPGEDAAIITLTG